MSSAQVLSGTQNLPQRKQLTHTLALQGVHSAQETRTCMHSKSKSKGKNLFQISLAQVGLIWLLSLLLLPFSPFPCLLWVHAEQPLLVKIISFVTSDQFQCLGENRCKFETGVVFFGEQVPKPKPRSLFTCPNLTTTKLWNCSNWEETRQIQEAQKTHEIHQSHPSQKCSWSSSH